MSGRRTIVLACVLLMVPAFAASAFGAPTTPTTAATTPAATTPQERRLATRLERAGLSPSATGLTTTSTSRRVRLRLDRSGATGGNATVSIADAGHAGEPLVDHRSAETAPDALVIAATDSSGGLVWSTTVADPTLVRAESPDADGALHRQDFHQPSSALDVSIPDDPAIARLEVFEPKATAPGGLTPLDSVAVPSSNPTGAPPLAGFAASAPPAPISAASSSDNRVDVVILGDGYTAAEQATFAADAVAAYNGLLDESPFDEYAPYFTMQTVAAVSAESGADHPERFPAVFVDTAFDATYGCFGIDRLICVDTAKVMTALAGLDATERDVVLVLINDPTYGGAGGYIATASTHPAVLEVVRHEIGHGFGLLADEYDYGNCNPFADYAPNITSATLREDVKWNVWIDEATAVPTLINFGVPGVYEGANYCTTGLYRPTFDSKMRSLDRPFEQVNSEQLVKRIYDLVSPIDASSPDGATVKPVAGGSQVFSLTPLRPQGRDLAIEWLLDDSPVGTGETYTVQFDDLSAASHTLRGRVTDPTALVRTDPEGLLTATREWTITSDLIAIGDASVVEGDGGQRRLTFPVTLSQPASQTITVDYAIEPGSATTGSARTVGADFNYKGGYRRTLTFKTGSTGTTPVSKFVSVPVYPDAEPEVDESFTVTLSSPTGGYALNRAVGTGTIVDDDATAKSGIELSAGDVSITEGAVGRRIAKAALTLSSVAGGEVRVDYTIVDGTAECGPSKNKLPLDPANDCDDGKGVTRTAVFKAGTVKRSLVSFVFPDGIAEGDETYTILLSNPVGASIRDGDAVITIIDDD